MNTSSNITGPSNFFAANLPSLITNLMITMRRKPGYMSVEMVSEFLRSVANKHLVSIGQGFDGLSFRNVSRINPKLMETCAGILQFVYDRITMEGCEVALDSGGFDLIQQGRLPSRLFREYIEFYHEFLVTYSHLFTMAFHLDIAPGYQNNPFSTEKEMDDANYLSYASSDILPEEIRAKMAYIHHFRTPAILRVWRKLLFQDRLADNFDTFSTGGLATSPKMRLLSCLPYALPLVDILYYVKQHRDLQSFRFHILGDSDWKALLPHMLLEKHLKEVHGLDVSITYDSSSLFQSVGKGRFTFAFIKDRVFRISLRSDELNRHHNIIGTEAQLFYRTVNEALVPYGFRPLESEKDPIYAGFGQMSTEVYSYAYLAQLVMFGHVEAHCRMLADRLYPVYSSGDIQEFKRQVAVELKKLHSGVSEYDVSPYAAEITTSLTMLKELDLDFVASQVALLKEEENFGT